MNTHTPEPWRLDEVFVADADQVAIRPENGPELLAIAWRGAHERYSESLGEWLEDEPMTDAEVEANAARIVACVNNCAGINPEAVPMMRDALEEMKFFFDEGTPVHPDALLYEGLTFADIVRAALAKCDER